MRQRRFDSRQNFVLSFIYNFIVSHIKESCVLADLPGQAYCFPVHIATTDERPDIVIWMDYQCTLVELTVPFEDNFTDAECRKRDRYADLLGLCTRWVQNSTDNDSGWLKRSSGLAISVQTQADVQDHSESLEFVPCVISTVSYLRVFCNLVQSEHQISAVHFCCTSL